MANGRNFTIATIIKDHIKSHNQRFVGVCQIRCLAWAVIQFQKNFFFLILSLIGKPLLESICVSLSLKLLFSFMWMKISVTFIKSSFHMKGERVYFLFRIKLASWPLHIENMDYFSTTLSHLILSTIRATFGILYLYPFFLALVKLLHLLI